MGTVQLHTGIRRTAWLRSVTSSGQFRALWMWLMISTLRTIARRRARTLLLPSSVSRSTPDLVCSLASEEGGRAMHCYLQPPNAWACCFKSHSLPGCAYCPGACTGSICDNVCRDSTKTRQSLEQDGFQSPTGGGRWLRISLSGRLRSRLPHD